MNVHVPFAPSIVVEEETFKEFLIYGIFKA